MGEVLTVMPSVPARDELRAETLAQAECLGLEAHVEMSRPEDGHGPHAQGLTAGRALRWALDRGATHILYLEDDIRISPRLLDVLPRIVARNVTTTLYLPGIQFYPPKTQVDLLVRGVTSLDRVVRVPLEGWFGAQGLVLPAGVAEAITTRPRAGRFDLLVGIDVALQRFLTRTDGVLYGVVPNVVQHRMPPSVTARSFRSHRSLTFDRRLEEE